MTVKNRRGGGTRVGRVGGVGGLGVVVRAELAYRGCCWYHPLLGQCAWVCSSDLPAALHLTQGNVTSFSFCVCQEHR